MNKQISLAVLLGFGLCTLQANGKEAAPPPTNKSKVSYGMGVGIGKNFKRLELDVDLDTFMKGIKDGYAGNKLSIPEDELHAIMSAYQNELRAKQAGVVKKIGEANQKEEVAFLAENAKKPGVVTLPSGLQYKILKVGTGNKPTEADLVERSYRGTLLNGTEFDSSYRTGKPALFNVGGVIPGWQEALKLMPVGSKWQIFIPSKLASGGRAGILDPTPPSSLRLAC